MTDALNQPIELGRVYGYSQNSNGLTNIVVGRVIKQNEKSVTLEVISRKTALYAKDPELVVPKDGKHNSVSCKGNMLFPVSTSERL